MARAAVLGSVQDDIDGVCVSALMHSHGLRLLFSCFGANCLSIVCICSDPEVQAALAERDLANQNLAITSRGELLPCAVLQSSCVCFSLSHRTHTGAQVVDRDAVSEYIGNKRSMFLVQYSLGVKRQEIRKLEELAIKVC